MPRSSSSRCRRTVGAAVAALLVAAAVSPVVAAEPDPPSSTPVVEVTAGAQNVQTFEVAVPASVGPTPDVVFTVLRDGSSLGSVDADAVDGGSVVTGAMQLELRGEYAVTATLDDGVSVVDTAPTTFTVLDDLSMPDPVVAPADDVAAMTPTPIDVDLASESGGTVSTRLPEGYAFGEVLLGGSLVEVVDADGVVVGSLYLVAALEDGRQMAVTIDETPSAGGRTLATAGHLRADVRCVLRLDCSAELVEALGNGLTRAMIAGVWIEGAARDARGRVTQAAIDVINAFTRGLVEAMPTLPLELDLGLLPDALSVADAPRFREGVGPADQVLAPRDYLYDPGHPDVSLHDYCTVVESWSFDTQFFGPCAVHDLCIERIDPAVGFAEQRERRALCDVRFGRDLQRNCVAQNPPSVPSRRGLLVLCSAAATSMAAVVTVKGQVVP